MVTYFLLANVYGGLFYSLYLFTLKNSNQFSWSRGYLLLAALLSLLLPFVRLTWPTAAATGVQQALQLPEIVLHTAKQTAVVTNQAWLFFCYSGIVLLLLGRLVYRLFRLQLFLKQQHFKQVGAYRIALHTGYGPASFGKAIIFPGAEAPDMILRHEMAHSDRGHHYDRISLQLLECLLFPVISLRLIRKELEIVQEFEADALAVKDTQAYALLLLAQHLGHNLALLPSFFHHPLKRRIMMLQHRRKGKRGLLITALAFMVTGIVLLQSTGSVMAQKKMPQSVKPVNKELTPYEEVGQVPDPGFDLMQYLAENIKYPESASKKKVNGNVVAQFVIEPDGRLEDIKIVKGIDPECDQEVLRVIAAMPAWKPVLKKDGTPARVVYTLPVKFKLQ